MTLHHMTAKSLNIENSMSPYINPEELYNLLKKTNENTESSPSNLHMGHYIVMSHSRNLLNIISIVISLPFVYGFTHEILNKFTHHII